VHAAWASRVKPSEVEGATSSRPWRGHLYLSGLDHVLDEAWMQWYGATAVVNFIDLSVRMHEPRHVPLVRAFQKQHGTRMLLFIIAFNLLKDRNSAVQKFPAISQHLNSTDQAGVIFHGVNGRDRSGFGLRALLRLQYGYSNAAARAAMAHRRTACGAYPLVHLTKVNELWWEWLENALGDA
jgi:hypothetical protein